VDNRVYNELEAWYKKLEHLPARPDKKMVQEVRWNHDGRHGRRYWPGRIPTSTA